MPHSNLGPYLPPSCVPAGFSACGSVARSLGENGERVLTGEEDRRAGQLERGRRRRGRFKSPYGLRSADLIYGRRGHEGVELWARTM
jgi:hypothetical protein